MALGLETFGVMKGSEAEKPVAFEGSEGWGRFPSSRVCTLQVSMVFFVESGVLGFEGELVFLGHGPSCKPYTPTPKIVNLLALNPPQNPYMPNDS